MPPSCRRSNDSAILRSLLFSRPFAFSLQCCLSGGLLGFFLARARPDAYERITDMHADSVGFIMIETGF